MPIGLTKSPVDSPVIGLAPSGAGGGFPIPPIPDTILFYSSFEGTAGADATGHTPDHLASGVTMTLLNSVYSPDGKGITTDTSGAFNWLSLAGLPNTSGTGETRTILLNAKLDANVINTATYNESLLVHDRYASGSTTSGPRSDVTHGHWIEITYKNGGSTGNISGLSSMYDPGTDSRVAFSSVRAYDHQLCHLTHYRQTHSTGLSGDYAFSLAGNPTALGFTGLSTEAGHIAGELIVYSMMVF